jgi:outer membrane protein assembly factor BamD (BamD/ComL family)
MKHFSFPRRCMPRLLLAVAISVALPASAADLNKRLKVKQNLTEVVMGQVMHDFYLGHGFDALNSILTAKAEGMLSDDVTATEILLGDLYTAFGMPDAADNVFSRIITRDMRSETRNETWFRQGRLKYRQGDYFEAERILNVPISTTEIVPLEAERRVMLANVLMGKNEFDQARDLLAPIPMDTALGMYATYNMGVAFIRANQPSDGIRLLETVMALPVSDHETNALKDRAALAIGYSHLQAKDPEKAREALGNVRLEGPFSNSAMLALGYAHYLRNDHKRALSFWLELMTRNPAESAVQEAMLLAPRAYEALQANQQAFFGYKLAAQSMSSQLTALDQIANQVNAPAWLDQLNPSADGGSDADPLDAPGMALPTNPTETAFLSSLFASHTFNEAYLQYQQLRRLQTLLTRRNNDLLAMRDLANNMTRRQSSLSAQENRVAALERRTQALQDHWPALQSRARATARNSRNLGDTMSPQDREKLNRLEQLEGTIQQMTDGPAKSALSNRIRILKGLHGFDVANRAPRTQNQMLAELTRYENELRQLRKRAEALRQSLEDNKRVTQANISSRSQTLESQLGAIQKRVGTALTEHRNYLGALASAALEDKRNRISNDLAEAYLNIARLQDAALIREGRPADTTQP